MPTKWVIRITSNAMSRCSVTTFQGCTPCSLAIIKLNTPSMDNPKIALINTAADSLKSKTGIINISAKNSFDRKAEIVDSQISFVV